MRSVSGHIISIPKRNYKQTYKKLEALDSHESFHTTQDPLMTSPQLFPHHPS